MAVVEAEMDTKNFVGKKATVLFVNLVSADGREAEVRLVDPSRIHFLTTFGCRVVV